MLVESDQKRVIYCSSTNSEEGTKKSSDEGHDRQRDRVSNCELSIRLVESVSTGNLSCVLSVEVSYSPNAHSEKKKELHYLKSNPSS